MIIVVIMTMILAGTAFGATYRSGGDSLYKIGKLFDTSADVIRVTTSCPAA